MIHCVRCEKEQEQLPAPPWGGEQGEEIHAKVCVSCWREWQEMQTKVINEFHLNLADVAHAERLDKHMLVYLKLATPEEVQLEEAPFGFGEGGPEGTGEKKP